MTIVRRHHDHRTAFARLAAILAALASTPVATGVASSLPYTHAFSFSGPTPRVVHVGGESVVPLAIVNTGQHGWAPERVHVSYHWLWLIPLELTDLSRKLPYHEGVRTELGRAVPPEATVAVQAKLVAPQWPGLYWLQWDMVEEGVAWFAAVSPRQPRTLIIVLPTAAGLFAPLPFLAVLLGLGTLGVSARQERLGSRRPALEAAGAHADVVWCAATLAAKPLILARDVLLQPTPLAYGLIAVIAVGPPLIGLAMLPRRIRPWMLVGCGAFGTLLVLADLVYFRFFGDVLSVPAMLAARQIGQVRDSIRSLFGPGMLWIVLDVPLAFWLAVRLARWAPARGIPFRRRVVAAAAATAVLAAGAVPAVAMYRAGRFEQMYRFQNRAMMEQLGPFGYHAFDTWNYARSNIVRSAITLEQVDQARAWFAERAPLRAGTGPYFGAAAGLNLIVIQVESLQDFAIDYRVDGQEVMPNLRRWTEEGLRFTNVTDQTSEGRTSDAEFTALVSLPPLDHGAAAFLYSGNHYVGLPSVLAERGYATLSAVPFEPGFWNRRLMHPAYGFQQSLFGPDFELTDQIGWGLNDREFLRQMAPRLAKLSRPFAAWLITLSLHHPFDDFPEKHKVLNLGVEGRTSFGNYLHTMNFFDRALADFEAALAPTNLLDQTLFVVFGDHDAGFRLDPPMARRLDIKFAAAWELTDRVPLLLRLPARAGVQLKGSQPMAAGQIDFAPTLLALLGIDPAPLPYAGRNLLGRPDNSPLVRPYGDWIDQTHLFFGAGVRPRDLTCFALASATYVDDSICRPAGDSARRARDVARLVVTGDLQQRLREALR